MGFGVLGLGLILLALFAVFYYLRIFATVTAILALVSTVMVGGNGVIGGLLVRLMHWLAGVVNNVTVWAFGGSALAVVTVIAFAIYIHDLHPKHAAGRRTAHLGLLLGLLLLTGLTGISALSGAAGTIQHSTTTIFSSL